MATSDDRRAARVLLALAALGLLARLVVGAESTAPGALGYEAVGGARPALDSIAARAARLARPLGPAERIDVDRAPADALARLPGIGAGLAGRIVSDRAQHGGFGSLAALGRVPGVGATLLARLRPHVTFSAPVPPTLSRAGGTVLDFDSGRATGRRSQGPLAAVPINTASAKELESLPGIGPALAQRIVAERVRGGPFRRLEDLRRVKGIGPKTVARLKGRIRLP